MAGEGFKIADAYADITANDNTAAGVDAAKAKLDTITDKNVTVDVDTSKGISSLTSFDSASTKSLGMFTAITAGAGAAAAAIGAMPAGLTALGGVLGVLGISFNGVDDAMTKYGKDLDKGMTSSAAFADATKKLNDPQKEFVTQLIATQTALKPLEEATAASFLPGLTEMLKDSNGLFPIFQGFLTQTGTIMSDTAKKLGDLFKTDQFKQNLETLESSTLPITQAVGDALVQMTDKIVDFGAKMQPAAQGLADFIKDASQGISDFLDQLAPHADSFKQIFDSLGTIIKDLLPVIANIAGDISDSLAPALKTVADWMDNNKDKIQPIVEGLAALWVTLKAAGLVADVTKWVTAVITQFGLLTAAIGKIPKGALTLGLGAAAAFGLGEGAEALGGALNTGEDPNAPGASGQSQLSQGLTTTGDLFTGQWTKFLDEFKKQMAAFPAQAEAAFQPVKNWFTVTVPQFFQTQVVQKLTTAWTAITTFFTTTIPQAFTTFGTTLTTRWQAIATIFTTTIPQAWDAFKTMLTTKWTDITTFFTTTVPQAWDAFKTMLAAKWTVVTNFFTQDIPQAWDAFKTMLSTKWTAIVQFFTTDVPQAWDTFKQMLSDKWQAISDFFSNTVSTAWDTIKQMFTDKWQAISDFFTNTVSAAWDTIKTGISDGWQKISDWFTQTIPTFFSSTLPGLVQTAWNSFVSAVESMVSSLASAAAGGSGPSGNAPSSANGNLFTPMANGGLLGGLTPMSGSLATVVPPNTWRVVGDNLTHPELFAPLDGSQRSLKLLQMAAGTFGQQLVPNAAPAPSAGSVGRAGHGKTQIITINIQQPPSSPAEAGRMVALALRTAG
jgi:hypothetical protein